MDKKLIELPERPEEKINTQKVFGFDAGFDVFGFKEKTEWVPMIDETYVFDESNTCLLYTSPSPRDQRGSRMPSSA